MDVMKIKDLFFVGVTEVILILFILISIYDVDTLKTMKSSKNESLLKIVASVIIILIINYLSKKYFHNFLVTGALTVFIYIVVLKAIWRLNFRSSIFFGMLGYILIVTSEIIMFPIMNMMIDINIVNPMLLEDRFELSLPSKLFQLLILFTFIKLDLKISTNRLFKTDWVKMSIDEIVNICWLIIMQILVIIFIGNSIERLMKFRFQDIQNIIIKGNMHLFYIGTILIVAISIIIFKRVLLHEFNRQLSDSPKEAFQTIIQSSTREDIELYIKLLAGYLNIVTLEDIEDIFSKLLHKKTEVRCNLDEKLSLTICDYSDLFTLFEHITDILYSKFTAKSLRLDMFEENNTVITNITMELDELQKIRFKRFVVKNRDINEIKNKLFLENNAVIDINYRQSIVDFEVKMPIREVIFDETKE